MLPRLVRQGTPEGVEDNGSLTRVAAFPIGIEPERFATALEDDAVRASIAQLLNKYAGRKVRDCFRCAPLPRDPMGKRSTKRYLQTTR